MKKTIFKVAKMDCPSEEQLIRMALSNFQIINFEFDLSSRKVSLIHEVDSSNLLAALDKLNLGAELYSDTETTTQGSADDNGERKVLWILLTLNFLMFVLEIGVGFYAQSAGLISDSMDMLADAIVYGLSLLAVGRSIAKQRKVTLASGWFQGVLAAGALLEVIRRYIFGSEPSSQLMIAVSVLALLVNVGCLVLLMRHRKGKIHMQASWIFSSNDVLANIGVMVSGLLVSIFASPYPDLVVGFLIAVLVASGSIRILKLASVQGADNA